MGLKLSPDPSPPLLPLLHRMSLMKRTGGILSLNSFFEMLKKKKPAFYVSGRLLCSKKNTATQKVALNQVETVGYDLKGSKGQFPVAESFLLPLPLS